MNRYAKFKESSLESKKKTKTQNKTDFPRIKKIVQSVLGEAVAINKSVLSIIHGMAKIYAGELVEEAKQIMMSESIESKPQNPILPRHLREARRRADRSGKLPKTGRKSRVFK